MKKIIILGLVVLFQLSSYAQHAFDLKNAEAAYKKQDYFNAQVNFEVYLSIRKPLNTFSPYTLKRKNNLPKADSSAQALNLIATSQLITPTIAWQLGESYQALYHYIRAEACYARLIAMGGDTAFSMTHFNYGVCLRCNNKLEEAEQQFNQFKNANAASSNKVAMATKELNTIAYIKTQVAKGIPALFTINKLKGNIEQTEGAYAPIFFHDTLVFTSARIVDTVNKYSRVNMHVNHLFYNTITNQDVINGKATMLRFPSKLSENEGTAALTSDNNFLFFARTNEVNSKSFTSIYQSKRINDSLWTEPVKLDSKINKEGHNAMQPSVTPDNKYLLFASDREGGAGKFDIWAAALDASGTPSEPFNLVNINTKEDEEAPFYHVASKMLVFASKGYQGMGGFDIYAAQGSITALQTPVNLGYPTNSQKDDIYFFSTSTDSLLKTAFISSDRASDCCLEIFALHKQYPKKYKQRIKGVIIDCDGSNPIEGANVGVNNTAGNYSLTSKTTGVFNIDIADSVTGFEVKKEGYYPKAEPFTKASNLTNDTVYNVSICLNKIPVEKPVDQEIDSINGSDKPLIVYFDFDKSNIKQPYDSVLNEVVAIMNKYPSIKLVLSIDGHTDGKGTDEYNIKLGERRAEACKQFIVDKKISADRLSLKSFGKSTPAAPNTTPDKKDNPEGRALNRRAELRIKAEKK